MSWIADLFGALLFAAGIPVPQRRSQNFEGAVQVVDDPVKKRTRIIVGQGGAPGTFTDLHATGTTTLDGAVISGPEWSDRASTTTFGAANSALFRAPLANNSSSGLRYQIVASDGVAELVMISGSPEAFSTRGAPTHFGAAPSVLSNFGLPVSVTPSWSAGVLTITCAGPSVVVTGAADNGAGKVRLTVVGGLASPLTGQSVTVSGIVGTIEANGTHAATYVDATHLDFAGVAFANAYTSGGLVVFATPPNIHWSGSLALLVAT